MLVQYNSKIHIYRLDNRWLFLTTLLSRACSIDSRLITPSPLSPFTFNEELSIIKHILTKINLSGHLVLVFSGEKTIFTYSSVIFYWHNSNSLKLKKYVENVKEYLLLYRLLDSEKF